MLSFSRLVAECACAPAGGTARLLFSQVSHGVCDAGADGWVLAGASWAEVCGCQTQLDMQAWVGTGSHKRVRCKERMRKTIEAGLIISVRV